MQSDATRANFGGTIPWDLTEIDLCSTPLTLKPGDTTQPVYKPLTRAHQLIDQLAPGIAVASRQIRLAANAQLEFDNALPLVRAEVRAMALAIAGDQLLIDHVVPLLAARNRLRTSTHAET